MQAVHPGWQICLYDDRDMQRIMEASFPGLLTAFNAFPLAIQRTDLFRMLIVYLRGGFYADTDIWLYHKLDALLENGLVLAEEKRLTEPELQLPYHKHEARIANYMFGAVAGHPFLADFVLHALQSSSLPITQDNDVLETTGPGALTNFYHETKDHYEDILLLENGSRSCPKQCSSQPSCHFGDYAAHHHAGSWRTSLQ